MSQPSLFFGDLDNILRDATVVATPDPMDTYDADTVLTSRPSARVRWDAASPSNDVTLAFTLPEARRADVLVVPVWNVDGGSPAVARLTSGAGLNVDIQAPAMPRHSIPLTTAIDLRLLASIAQRTSTTFSLIIEGNTNPVTYGGAVLLYTTANAVCEFPDRDWQWGYRQRTRGRLVEHENEYGTDYVHTLRTQTRQLTLSALASEDDRTALEAWFTENFGRGRPCFVWVDPEGRDLRYFGRAGEAFEQVDDFEDIIGIAITVDEISKGKPV